MITIIIAPIIIIIIISHLMLLYLSFNIWIALFTVLCKSPALLSFIFYSILLNLTLTSILLHSILFVFCIYIFILFNI